MAAPTETQVARVVRRIVAEGSGIDSSLVIPGNDPHPAPQSLYASVLLVNSWVQGAAYDGGTVRDEVTSLDVPSVVLNVTSVYSVQWYREGAMDVGVRFRMWCESSDGASRIAERGMLLSRCGDLRRLDFVISSNYEERAGLDLTLRHVQSMGVVRDPVQTVEIAIGSEEATVGP